MRKKKYFVYLCYVLLVFFINLIAYFISIKHVGKGIAITLFNELMIVSFIGNKFKIS